MVAFFCVQGRNASICFATCVIHADEKTLSSPPSFSLSRQVCEFHCLSATPPFVDKLLQLYQIQLLHHGLMAVGPSGTGKTTAWRVLLQVGRRRILGGAAGWADERRRGRAVVARYGQAGSNHTHGMWMRVGRGGGERARG